MSNTFQKINDSIFRDNLDKTIEDYGYMAVYHFLRSYIVRDSASINKESKPIRDGFFYNKKLAVSYPQDIIAEKAKCDIKTINRKIKKLEDKGYIKIHKRNAKNNNFKLNVYEVGYYTGTWGENDYEEHYFIDEILEQSVQNEGEGGNFSPANETGKEEEVDKREKPCEKPWRESEEVNPHEHKELMKKINKTLKG